MSSTVPVCERGDDLHGIEEMLLIDRETGQLNLAPASLMISRNRQIPVFQREFWTAKQRQAASIHEISYRACFKPQLPRFFINQLSRPGDLVYDPFSGRGTTAIEAALLGRKVIANDANPLSALLCRPRLQLPDIDDIANRLENICLAKGQKAGIDLSMFYHPITESHLVCLKQYLQERKASRREDAVDGWIRMVATNRLTGHSPGFFSVYTLPPNQAVSAERQRKINQTRSQIPPLRDISVLILKKSRQLLNRVTEEQRQIMRECSKSAMFLNVDAGQTTMIAADSVQLTVTSPPFLNVVQYGADNWLRCWFNGYDAVEIARKLTLAATLPQWHQAMQRVFIELYRITRPGGYVAFEVGEVRKGKIRLDEEAIPLGISAGFDATALLINRQNFTKTANIWGIRNNKRGTNSNRIIVFRKS